MREEQKKRLIQLAKAIGEILLIGCIYLIFIKITGWTIPCPIKLITGKYCPGCGITQMMLAFFTLDFERAYMANRLLFFLLPIMLIYGLVKGIYYICTGKNKQSVIEQIGILVVFVCTVIFWILRNTQAYSYLAPPVFYR